MNYNLFLIYNFTILCFCTISVLWQNEHVRNISTSFWLVAAPMAQPIEFLTMILYGGYVKKTERPIVDHRGCSVLERDGLIVCYFTSTYTCITVDFDMLYHKWSFLFWCVYELFNFKNVFIDKHGLLSGICIVPYSNPNVNGWGLYHGTVCDCGVIAKTPCQMSIICLWYKTYTPRAKQTRPSDS